MKRGLFIALIILLSLFGVFIVLEKDGYYLSLFKKILSYKNKIVIKEQDRPVIWLNIFVHGTIGVSLAFLDFSAVQADAVENSLYKKTVSVMRKDRCFYQDQPIADKGLQKIEPSFDFLKKNDCYYAAFPIIQAFDDISSLVTTPQTKEQNLYYLYGWSGILSQKRRRSEAMRFYNQLSAEVDIFRKLGFKPKVRILTHSHGGNLCLNLAGFYHCLNNDSLAEKFYSNFNISSYVKDLFDRALGTSFEKEVAITKKGQKRFDYCPEKKDLFVEELIMLGTPIQEETSLFIASPFFGTVFNIYSDADVIQSMDYVTTVKKESLQKIDDGCFGAGKYYQVRIKVNPLATENATLVATKKASKIPWWQVLLGLRDTSRKSPHPTHKELWFIVPPDKTLNNFLRPFPIVCFYPIMKHLQNQGSCHRDFDFEITQAPEKYIFTITDKENNVQSFDYSAEYFEQLKEKMSPWIMPKDNTKIMRNIMDKFLEMKES